LTRIAGQPVGTVDDVQLAVSILPPGSVTTVEYGRGGETLTTKVTLAKLAVSGKPIATVRPEAWRGMRVDFATALESIALSQAANSGALDAQGCVLVTEVEHDSTAWREGVRPGMFVTHVGDKRVTTPAEFHVAAAKLGESFDLKFTTQLSPDAATEEDTR
jgi:serine protease Do